MRGPGKYDDLATYVREKAEAGGVILIVLGGNQGTGFEVQLGLPKELQSIQLAEETMKHAQLLRGVADEMQRDARRMRAAARGN